MSARQPSDWQPESFEMKVTDEAIDHLKAAVRAFGNNNDSRALCDIENAVCRLLDSRDIEKVLIDAVRSHMHRCCFVEVL